MNRLLIIDDDVELCDLLIEYLSAEKFLVECVHNGADGLEELRKSAHDLLILDVMLPSISGIEILKQLRTFSKLPVIMLTARGDEVDRILGLELGADDYLAKPFSARELVARIRAVFRRSGAVDSIPDQGNANRKLEIDGVLVEPSTRRVLCDGEQLSLTEVEFCILEQLMKSAGSVVERQSLAEAVLGRRLSYDDRSLDVHMSNLRKKLGSSTDGPERIKTVRGVGYLYVKPEN